MIKKLILNSSSNVAITLMRIGIAFVMSPVIVKALGNYDYGIWEMVISVIGYLGILDLGMSPAIVRYVARYNALNEKENLDKLYSSSLVFLGVMGLISLVIFGGWAGWKPDILAEKGSNPIRYTYLLLLVGIDLLIKFPGIVSECFHNGFQRYTLRNKVNTTISIVSATTTLVLLKNGYGLITFVFISTLETLLRFIIHTVLVSFSRYGNLLFKVKNVSWGSIREPISFGYKSLVNYLSGMLAVTSDSIIIGVLLGPIAVTFFAIPAKLVLILSGLLGAVTLSFLPFFSDLDARDDRNMAVKSMIIASKIVAGLMIPILITTCFLGVSFLTVWMGAEYAEKGQWVLYILGVAYAFSFINPFHIQFLTGVGLHGFLAKINLTASVINIVLSIILVKFIGKEGAALGTLIAAIIFSPIILAYTCKCLEISIWTYIKNVVLTLIIPNMLLSLLLWLLISNIVIDSYFKIIAAGIFSIFAYGILYITIFLRRDEKDFILSKVGDNWFCKVLLAK